MVTASPVVEDYKVPKKLFESADKTIVAIDLGGAIFALFFGVAGGMAEGYLLANFSTFWAAQRWVLIAAHIVVITLMFAVIVAALDVDNNEPQDSWLNASAGFALLFGLIWLLAIWIRILPPA